MNLKDLEKEIANCTRCELYKYRKNPVPGEGNPNSGIMLIGEAPGREEDEQGKPFVGKAGMLLTELIEKIVGISREDVYITNVLKCRPPNNRDPKEEEIEKCSIFLKKQLEIIKPNIIICLGRFSSRFIFNYFDLKYSKLSNVRGKVFVVEKWDKKVNIIPTYHPAAALYRNYIKEILIKDFKLIKEIINNKKIKRKTLLDYMGP